MGEMHLYLATGEAGSIASRRRCSPEGRTADFRGAHVTIAPSPLHPGTAR